MTMKYVTFCIKIIIDKTFLKEHFAFTAEEEMPHWGLSLKNQTFVTTAAPFGIVNVISYKLLLLALLMLFHTQVRVSSGKSHCLQYCLGEGGRLSLWLQQVENRQKELKTVEGIMFFF